MWAKFDGSGNCVVGPQSMAPWGEAWVSDDIKAQYEADGWKMVSDDYRPPAPQPTTDELLAVIRTQRDNLLRTAQDRVDRYNNQKAANITTKDTPTQIQAVLLYMQALRDFPSTCDPTNPAWPAVPV